MKIVITKHFGGVMALTGMLALQHYYSGFGIIVPLRKQIFKREFMGQFDPNHKAYFNTEGSPYGYPDNGAGLYSKQLSYYNWYRLN